MPMNRRMKPGGERGSIDLLDPIALLIGREKHPDGSATDQFAALNNCRTLEFDAGNASFQALIERDILRIGVLTQSPDGHFSFAF